MLFILLGSKIFDLSPELLNDKEVMLAVTKLYGPLFHLASCELKNDKEFALQVCSIYGKNVSFLSPELRSDKDIAMAAVKQDGTAIQYLDDELKNDLKVASLALAQNGEALQFLSKEMRDNKALAITAVTNNGYALKYVSDNLKKDKEVIRIACRENSQIVDHSMQSGYSEAMYPILQMIKLPIVYADHDTLKDKDFALELANQCGINIKYFSPELQNDEEVASAAIHQNPWALTFSGNDIKRNVGLVEIAIHTDVNIKKYSYISEAMEPSYNLDEMIAAAENKKKPAEHSKNSIEQYL